MSAVEPIVINESEDELDVIDSGTPTLVGSGSATPAREESGSVSPKRVLRSKRTNGESMTVKLPKATSKKRKRTLSESQGAKTNFEAAGKKSKLDDKKLVCLHAPETRTPLT